MRGWQPGEIIRGRWEIARVLRGGMGVVYVGYDREWREAFAAKTFQDEVFARSPEVAKRFVREALAWISLDAHLNIAEARRVEDIDGRPLLFLEYVSGGDLVSWIGSPRLIRSLRRVLRLALQFCDGMAHATSKGLVAHRDVKPANCLITEDGILKITDFGLAIVATDRQTEPVAGTVPYMPPEQFDHVKRVDVRADVYAFGVMMFEMITGARPFKGTSFGDLAWQHCTQPAPRLEHAPARLADIVAKCLAKEPDARFHDFGELRVALVEVYREETGEEPPPPVSGDALNAARLNNKALSLLKLGHADEAVESFDASLLLDGTSARAWANKAAALGEGLGRWDESLACTERAVDLDPTDVTAWTNRGMALHARGRAAEALMCYERALESDETSAVTWSNKATAMHGIGRAEEALASIDQSLVLDPTSDAAWWNKSAILRALGRADEALASLDRVLELNPRFAQAWLNKGVALRALGRVDEALACYRRAVELDPTYVIGWSNLGNALLLSGHAAEAVPCYDRALALDPTHAGSRLNREQALTLLRGA
jgi:serine/threonine protein kinase/predicted TPR repeat methyltransferase